MRNKVDSETENRKKKILESNTLIAERKNEQERLNSIIYKDSQSNMKT